MGDAPLPTRHHFVVGTQESDVAFEPAVVGDQSAVAPQAIPKRGSRQRLQQIDGKHRHLRDIDERLDPRLAVSGVGVEAENNARRHLHPVVVNRFDRLHHRQGSVLLLAHGLECIDFRRLDADEHGDELCLAHQRENLRLLGDIECCLAGKLQRIAVLALPVDKLRQHFARRLAVADEIVVDEIYHRRMTGLRQHGVKLGDDLIRGLQPRLAAIKSGYVAELAAIRTPAGELQAADQITI
jgi:hypothetical protein